MIRTHKKYRVQPFHPLHRSTPPGVNIEEERATVLFQGGSRVAIIRDEWKNPASSKQFKDHQGQWKGFTFFKVSRKKGEKTKRQEVESDGSFEKVHGEDSW